MAFRGEDHARLVEITRLLQERFFGLFNGTTEDKWGWLDPVDSESLEQKAAS